MVSLRQTKEIENKIAELLVAKFDISDSLLKEVTKKITSLANKRVEETLKKNKDSLPNKGLGGLAKETLKKVSVKEKSTESSFLNKEIISRLKDIKVPLLNNLFKDFKLPKMPLRSSEYSIKDRFKEGGLFGLTKDLIKNFKLPFLNSKEKKDKKTSFLGSIKKVLPQKESERLTKDEEAPNKILLEGITENGFKNLSDRLPKILKGIFKEKRDDKKEDKKFSEKGLLGLLGPGLLGLLKGALLAGGGIALLLGGLAALITGLQTEGPFKGLLKILSNVGLAGGLKLLQKGANIFLKNMKSLINAPVNLMKMAYKGLRGIFGKGVARTITTVIGKSAGLFTKMATGLAKFITPLLKKIPIVGTAISLGFAYTRFKSGDVVGGVIDVMSGLAGLLSLTGVGIPAAIAISTGLDVLNAFLDFKTGGSTSETSQKKGVILGDFLGKIGSWISDNIKYVPIIGPAIEAGKYIASGDWKNALYSIAEMVPPIQWLTMLAGGRENVKEDLSAAGSTLGNWWDNIKSWIVDNIKNVPVIGPAIRAYEYFEQKEWVKGLTSLASIVPGVQAIVGLFGGTEKVSENISETATKAFDFFGHIKNALIEKIKPAFSYFAKIGEKIESKNYGGALMDIARLIPGVGWLVDLLENDEKITQDINATSEQSGVSGMMSDMGKLLSTIRESIKEKLLKSVLEIFPESVFGYPVRAKAAELLGMSISGGNTSTETSTPAPSVEMPNDAPEKVKQEVAKQTSSRTRGKSNTKTTATESSSSQTSSAPEIANVIEPKPPQPSPVPEVAMAEGGIVTKPTTALIGEAGHEAVIPLDKYMSPEGFKISNDILSTIAVNTSNTNETIANLSQAIFKLAQIFDKKTMSSANNVIINGQNQSQQYPSASQVAANNIDPIRTVRAQFAL
jgi:hypothetical protein